MTRRATGELGRRPDFVFDPQPGADLRLILRSDPIHVKYLISRPEHLFGLPMAVEAPLHQQGVGLKNQRHLVNFSVTRRAANAFIDMNAVIEIDEIRQMVHPDPLDGFIASIALTDWLKVGGSAEQNRMAVHTNLRWGNPCIRGGFHARVAVSAVDPVVADMVFVAKLHRLRLRDELTGHVRRTGG